MYEQLSRMVTCTICNYTVQVKFVIAYLLTVPTVPSISWLPEYLFGQKNRVLLEVGINVLKIV